MEGSNRKQVVSEEIGVDPGCIRPKDKSVADK